MQLIVIFLLLLHIWILGRLLRVSGQRRDIVNTIFCLFYGFYFVLKPIENLIQDLIWDRFPYTIFWNTGTYPYSALDYQLVALAVTGLFIALYDFHYRARIVDRDEDPGYAKVNSTRPWANMWLVLPLALLVMPVLHHQKILSMGIILLITYILALRILNFNSRLAWLGLAGVVWGVMRLGITGERRDLLSVVAILPIIYFTRTPIRLRAFIKFFAFSPLLILLVVLLKSPWSEVGHILTHHEGLLNQIDAPIVYDDFVLLINKLWAGEWDLLYGLTYSKIFTLAIPRDLLAIKPFGIDLQFALALNSEINVQTATSRPTTFLGELIWNFGLWLLPVYPWLVCRFNAFVDRQLHRSGCDPKWVILVAFYGQIFRGSLAVNLWQIGVMCLPALMAQSAGTVFSALRSIVPARAHVPTSDSIT